MVRLLLKPMLQQNLAALQQKNNCGYILAAKYFAAAKKADIFYYPYISHEKFDFIVLVGELVIGYRWVSNKSHSSFYWLYFNTRKMVVMSIYNCT